MFNTATIYKEVDIDVTVYRVQDQNGNELDIEQVTADKDGELLVIVKVPEDRS